MADQPAYTTVPGKLPDLLNKIREVGVPAKATKPWLNSLGYKSSNDPSMLNVLRYIGFIDSSGTPTPAWKQYRGSDHKSVLGRAIVLGYDSLFSVYPDAPQHPNADIAHVFSTQTDSGKQSIDKMVSTFKSLASIAEFDESTVQADPEPSTAATVPMDIALPVKVAPAKSGHLTVNLNIQLTLPETTDEKLLDAFFKTMKKHLLPDD